MKTTSQLSDLTLRADQPRLLSKCKEYKNVKYLTLCTHPTFDSWYMYIYEENRRKLFLDIFSQILASGLKKKKK